MRKLALFIVSVWMLAVIFAASAPLTAQADTNVWSGRVVHVSTANIKVYNPVGHKTLSFLLVPKFRSVFSDDGKTTIQMATIKPGTWVKIYYDQDFLGARHADKIVLVKSGKAMGS